jgi:hypothetical protein
MSEKNTGSVLRDVKKSQRARRNQKTNTYHLQLLTAQDQKENFEGETALLQAGLQIATLQTARRRRQTANIT